MEITIEKSADLRKAEGKRDELAKTVVEERKADEKSKAERWVSRKFSQHQVIVTVKDSEAEGGRRSEVVKFENYGLVLDLEDESQKALSEGLHQSGREGRDIFVVNTVYKENEIGDQAEMLKLLNEMGIRQLRAMVTLDEMMENGVPTNTRDPADIIPLILRTKRLGEEK